MENEVSGIAKLGIVLIALAVLIGLGFGIFQISKGTANTGVNNVQAELDGVAVSQYSTYDQTVVTGTIARSALSQYEGKETAILVATQAWVNYVHDSQSHTTENNKNIMTKGSGFDTYKLDTAVPVVWAYSEETLSGAVYEDQAYAAAGQGSDSKSYTMKTTAGIAALGSYINYNALLGSNTAGTTGVTSATYKTSSDAPTYNMAGIYFDKNCFRCTTGFMTSTNGRVQYNNVVGNIQKTGTTEFIPTGAKFQSYLVKDPSGTVMGIALQQINNV